MRVRRRSKSLHHPLTEVQIPGLIRVRLILEFLIAGPDDRPTPVRRNKPNPNLGQITIWMPKTTLEALRERARVELGVMPTRNPRGDRAAPIVLRRLIEQYIAGAGGKS